MKIKLVTNCDTSNFYPVFGESYNPNPVIFDVPEKTVSYRYIILGDYKLVSPENVNERFRLHEGWPHFPSLNIYYKPCDHFTDTRLFNIKRDPDELVNLAEFEEYEKKRDEMLEILNDWWPVNR